MPAILQRRRAVGARVTTIDELGEAVAKGDPVVDAALREVGSTIGRVLGMVAMALNPREVVIGGEIAHIAPARRVDGLFLGRFAHDVDNLMTVVDEAASLAAGEDLPGL